MNYIEVYFNDVLQTSYKIDQDTFVIGRSEDADIHLNNKGVSSFHALIELQDDRLYIKDMNSTNGTFLNDKRLTERKALELDDSIRISKFELKISDQASEGNGVDDSMSHDSADFVDDGNTIMVMPSGHNKAHSAVHDYLLVSGAKNNLKKLVLNKTEYSIGLAKDNDIVLQGWKFFTPQYVAEIHHIGEYFYFVPLKKSYSYVNGNPVRKDVRLRNNDLIQIKKLTLQFIHHSKAK